MQSYFNSLRFVAINNLIILVENNTFPNFIYLSDFHLCYLIDDNNSKAMFIVVSLIYISVVYIICYYEMNVSGYV